MVEFAKDWIRFVLYAHLAVVIFAVVYFHGITIINS